MNVQMSKSTEEFIKSFNELIKRNSDNEAEIKYLMNKLAESAAELTKEVQEYNKLDVPEIDGKKVVDFKIHEDKLTQALYIKELCEKLPDILQNLEVQGTLLQQEALKKSRGQ